jgi:hypothetical protein
MSPEEFDNRLRSSFNDEFAPPKEHLWHNINTRLDQKARKPVWYWLAPLLIVAVAAITWLSYSTISKNDTAKTNEEMVASKSTSAQSATSDKNTANSGNLMADNSSEENTEPPAPQTVDLNSASNTNTTNSPGVAGSMSPEKTQNPKTKKGSNSKNAAIASSNASGKTNNDNTGNSNTGINDITSKPATFNNTGANNTLSDNTQSVFSKLFFIKRFKRNFSIDWLLKAERSPIKWPEIKVPTKKGQTAEDMAWGGNFEDNEWWLNFGIGNQVAYNRFHATYDSLTKNKIHRTLINNEDQLTHNGSGFQMHLNVQNKFGKNNRFSFETGINFSHRTEDIKMNEQTYDIAARNNNEDILNYLRLKLFIAVGTDTTFFDATQSFALVTKNKYSIITVPLRFQYEQPINRNTFVSLGLGGGASIVKNNTTTHYDMVKEKEVQKNSSKYLTASLNTMLSLYTNYNGIGQFGIYGGYQMYLTPFKVNEQYSVRMSDLQFGVLFRRPLDLK